MQPLPEVSISTSPLLTACDCQGERSDNEPRRWSLEPYMITTAPLRSPFATFDYSALSEWIPSSRNCTRLRCDEPVDITSGQPEYQCSDVSSIISRSLPILTVRQHVERSVNGSSRGLAWLLGLGCDTGTVFIPE